MKNLHSLREEIPEEVLQAAANMMRDYHTIQLKWEDGKLWYEFKDDTIGFIATKYKSWCGPMYGKKDTTAALENLTRNSP